MISARQELTLRLEELEREIDQQISDVLRQGRRTGNSDTVLMVAIALAHGARTVQEIAEMTDLEIQVIRDTVETLVEQGISCKNGVNYRIRGNYAEDSG